MYALNENQLIYGNEIARIKKSGRLKIPDDFRKILFKNSRSHNLVLRIGATQNCLEVCDLSSDKVQFFNGSKQTKSNSSDKMRYRFSSITEIGMDDRISIPSFFRAQAQLDDYVIFLGTGNGFEIWNPALLLADEECGPFFKTLISHYVALGHLPENILILPGADSGVIESGEYHQQSERDFDDYLSATENLQEFSEPKGSGVYEIAELAHEADLLQRQDEAEQEQVSQEQEVKKIPIGSLTWSRRGKKLVYSAGIETMLGLAKQVDYISPILTLDNSEWVIVVHPQGMFSEKCVRPMWRSRIAEEEENGETQTSFPTDWRDYSEWAGYDSSNNQTRGLPSELCDHFRAYKTLINTHLLEAPRHGFGPLVANLGAMIGAGQGRLEDEASTQTIN